MNRRTIIRLALLALLVLLAGLATYRHGMQQQPYFRDMNHCEEWLKRTVKNRISDPNRKPFTPDNPWVGAVLQPRTPGMANEIYISWRTPEGLTSYPILPLDSPSLRHGHELPRWGNVVHTIPPGHPLLEALERAWREGGQI
jgi:hypothetical protein